jgi:putative redox protein
MGAYAKITWLCGKQYVGTDSSKHSVVMSSQDEENGTGMRPPDLLLVALAGCTAMGVTDILQKKHLDLKGVVINISGEQDHEPPHAFNSIEIEYVITGKEITEKVVEEAIQLSLGKYCSVSATVKVKAELRTKIRILDN